MTSSDQGPDQALRDDVARLCGAPIVDLEQVRGGTNSQLYRVTTADGRYALKVYPTTSGDPRDRLGTEVAAFKFLARHRIDSVPGVLAAHPKGRLALYEWINGPLVDEVTSADISFALDFARRLYALRAADGAADLPLASEACLSGAEVVRQIKDRLDRLQAVGTELSVLGGFLIDDVEPTFQEVVKAARRGYASAGLDFQAELPRTWQTLSPSDFGFHNARRRPDGGIVFLDFEYFGWDDPVKLAADFVLHPRMRFTEEQKGQVVAGCVDIYRADPVFLPRLHSLFPLYGLRWCMILLNEFVPEHWARRVHAGVGVDRGVALARQLSKAEWMLRFVKRTYKAFPYVC